MDNLADVVAILLSGVAIVIAILWNKASKGAMNVAGDAVERWRGCEDSIEELTRKVERLQSDIGNLERAQDEGNAEIKATNDFTYLMLQWVKDANILFRANEIEPPNVPQSFFDFGENYQGKFKRK